MPRATSKAELLKAAGEQFDKLFSMIDSLPADEQTAEFNFEDRDRNIRDVLAHLYEWHQLLLLWADANLKGEEKPFLPPPYNWKTYPEMNVEFWKKHQKTPYQNSRKMLIESHEKVIKLIETFTDEQLFTKKYYKWTGTTTLGSYCVSATASHYDWAMKSIKKHIKTYKTE